MTVHTVPATNELANRSEIRPNGGSPLGEPSTLGFWSGASSDPPSPLGKPNPPLLHLKTGAMSTWAPLL